jgi:hypothetical protein
VPERTICVVILSLSISSANILAWTLDIDTPGLRSSVWSKLPGRS